MNKLCVCVFTKKHYLDNGSAGDLADCGYLRIAIT